MARSSGAGASYPVFVHRTRMFALRFFQTTPHGDSPCVLTSPSPPSGWAVDFHPQTAKYTISQIQPLVLCARPTLPHSRCSHCGGGFVAQADANESHDWRIFADFAQVLIG